MSQHSITQKYENIVLAVFIVTFSYLFYTAMTSESYNFDGIASMTFPKYIIGAVIVLCVIRLVTNCCIAKKNQSAVLQKKEEQEESMNGLTPQQHSRKIMLTLLFIIVYSLLWNVLGFALSTCLFVFLEAKFLRPSSSWISCLVVGIGATVVLYFIFGFLFNVEFPEPILGLI